MADAKNKTAPTRASVAAFIEAVENPVRQRDARTLLALYKRVTGEKPAMWGPTIVGFGRYHYRYESGREGDSLRAGFSPRKAAMTLYVMDGFSAYGDLLARIGKAKTSVSCLYLGDLAKVDTGALEELIARSWAEMARRYPPE